MQPAKWQLEHLSGKNVSVNDTPQEEMMLRIAHVFTRFAIAGALAGTLASLGGAQGVAAASAKGAASVKVGIQPSAPADAGGLTAYTITATNDGIDAAGNVTIDVPFDSAALRFVGATFSQPEAWVSNLTANALEIKTGVVGGDGGSIKAVLRFQPLTSGGAPAVKRLAFEWTDKLEGGHGISNQLPGAASAYAPLTVSRNTREITFASDAFASGEGVFFWYNTPDGKVIQTRVRRGTLVDAEVIRQKRNDDSSYDQGAEYVIADNQGQVTVTLSTAALAPGTYTLVASGHSSALTAVAAFQVQ